MRDRSTRSSSRFLACLVIALVPCLAAGESPHPWVEIVDMYRQASRQGDLETLARLQADDARIWFGEKTGAGQKLDPAGKGPWADWDRYFNARSEALEVRVLEKERAVRITTLETNDWYRLVDRTPIPYYIFYFVDDGDRVSGKLIGSIDGVERQPDRLESFKTWAAARHPGLLNELLPDGKIDPGLDKAKLWKRHLLEWRAATGLPPVLAESQGAD